MDDGDKPFRVYRSDGDPRLTVAEQQLEDFVNDAYERDKEHWDAMTQYHMTYWMLYGELPTIR